MKKRKIKRIETAREANIIDKRIVYCRNKKTFKGKKQAIAGAKFTKKINEINLKPYKCPHCRKWHLTSQGMEKL